MHNLQKEKSNPSEVLLIKVLQKKIFEELKQKHFYGIDLKIRQIQKTAWLLTRV